MMNKSDLILQRSLSSIPGKPKTKAEISTNRKELKMYLNLNPDELLSGWESARIIEGNQVHD
jgi:hypothetical protein